MFNIKALKQPNIPHYEWQGELLEQTDDYVLVICKPGRKLTHHTKGKTFTVNNTSLEYFFFKEWYTVAIEIEAGKINSYYCNIAKPSIIENNEISFVDLDLDLIKRPGEDWQVVDEDEFVINSEKYNYSADLKDKAIAALADLQDKVRKREFPFNRAPLEQLQKKRRSTKTS